MGVVVMVAGGPLEREGGNGSEEVPDRPGHDHVVEEGEESSNTDDSLSEEQRHY